MRWVKLQNVWRSASFGMMTNEFCTAARLNVLLTEAMVTTMSPKAVQRGGRHFLPAQRGVYHILMNLIRHHQHAVPAAYLQQAAQLFLRPYAAHRVVRVAQNVQGYTLLHNLLFHGLEVEGVVHTGALQFFSQGGAVRRPPPRA